ncbi:MAG: methionine--tRNA ligase [Candidatus Ratteibacteria bacterium]|nr:methionine--tRNA ligase [Candidatus Ratteibacteria bacterium]
MKVYITTPIYYINAEPHIGHAYTTIAADTLARFYRMAGYDVFFLTGTDEHGQKIYDAAKKQNVSIKDFVDRNTETYRKLWNMLHISYTRFIRTTELEHEETVRNIFTKLLQKGDLYKDDYTGYYCIPCESYAIPEDENNPLCPDCKRPMNKISEPSYFFRISKYTKQLEKYIEENNFVKPDFRKNEVLNFIRSGLHDVSITRKNVEWGISAPVSENYTIYVWFDALINYLSGIGYLHNENLFSKFWPPDVQFIGKDIIRFHHIIWPCLLFALDLPLPKTIFAHGWWTSGKDKISKSKGNTISPEKIIDEYGLDALRYFLLREVPFGLDGEYSEDIFKKRYNSDLANDLGNLVNRTLNLVETKMSGIIGNIPANMEIIKITGEVFEKYQAKMQKIAFSEALEEIWRYISFLNRFLDEKAPWREGCSNVEEILNNTIYGIRSAIIMLTPFIPDASIRIWQMLGLEETPESNGFKLLNQKIPEGIKTNKREIIFPRKK